MKKIYALGVFIIALSTAAGYLYSAYIDRNTYTSYSQLIVLSPKTSNQANDYASIATSHSVLQSVQRMSGVNQSFEELQSSVKAANTSGTNIITVQASAYDPAESQHIVSAVTRAIGAQAEVLFGENNTSVVDEASLGVLTHRNDPLKSTLLGTAAGIAVAAMLIFVFYEPKKPAAAKKSSEDADVELPPYFANDDSLHDDNDEEVDIKPVGYKYQQRKEASTKRQKTSNSPRRKV